MKGRVFLIHWKAAEADEYASALRSWGWAVDFEAEDGARAGKLIKATPPDVVVIYLTRLPSHGRVTASYLRSSKATRHLPIVFVEGTGEAVEKTSAQVPDAVFTTSAELEKVLAGYARTG
ncbi:MAG: hypothetical protein HYY00_09145 [Chloroflexi bacterium]|nr:hypothetical protein [Chloroflexota bacterium]